MKTARPSKNGLARPKWQEHVVFSIVIKNIKTKDYVVCDLFQCFYRLWDPFIFFARNMPKNAGNLIF